ncbi:hypothetical protein D3C76_479160 [compost metagenome]
MQNLDQAKYQLAHLLGRAQFLASMINLNTQGYADVRFSPDHLNIDCDFAPTRADYDTRLNPVTREYIQVGEFLRTGIAPFYGTKEEKRVWKETPGDWYDPLPIILRVMSQLRNYNAVLESFLTDKGFDLEKHPNVRPYEQTIKYTVYDLRGGE